MLARKEKRYSPCSSGGTVLLGKVVLVGWEDSQLRGECDEWEDCTTATMDIKNRVEASRLGLAITLSKSDLVKCNVGGELFDKHIPREHLAQIPHQMLVIGIRTSLYASAEKTILLYFVLIRCVPELRPRCLDILKAVMGPCCCMSLSTEDDNLAISYSRPEGSSD